MLCCHCRKNQATKTYERITDGKKQTEYYCSDCYHRLFISVDEFDAAHTGKKLTVCPCCGTREEDFLSTGLVGCAHCYEALSSAVMPVVIRLQGIEAHKGAKPKNSDAREELIWRRNRIKKQIEAFMKSGNYEGASAASEELKKYNEILYGKGD